MHFKKFGKVTIFSSKGNCDLKKKCYFCTLLIKHTTLNLHFMKKIVVLTGAGMSVESGLKTFRDADGLWENYPVQQVATHDGWLRDPNLVTEFYNMLRRKCLDTKPNEGHRLVAELEKYYDVTVVTQNVDNLHEAAGSTKVIHLHGELMKVCSSIDPYDPRYIKTLTRENPEVVPGTKAGDGSLLRPHIVFFQEAVPMIEVAARECSKADIFIIIGTSLVVYPAAGLVHYVPPKAPIYLIDPGDVRVQETDGFKHLKMGASAGMKILFEKLKG